MQAQPAPQDQLMRFILGKWIAKPIYVVAELGIADLLADGPLSVSELAEQTDCQPDVLCRILRALASVGIFSETEPKRFGLTPMAEWLQDDKLRPMARMFNAPWNDRAWMSLLDSVRSGNISFDLAYGTDFMSWLGQHPKDAAILADANARKAAVSFPAIVHRIDFSETQTLMDLGGGTGMLMCCILQANPHLKGILADLPSVAAEARKTIGSYGFESRCEIHECDFFQSVPSGADAILLSNILHDWPDEACETILNNCHSALNPGGKLFVLEMIVAPGNHPSVARLLDLEMMVLSGGRERTEMEFRDLLSGCGFTWASTQPLDGELCLVEAIRN